MPTGATEFVDSTTADVFIPELWSSGAIVAREQKLMFARFVDLHYRDGLTFGDIIHVPSVGNLAARSKAKATNAAITYETVTETNTDITVATWEYTAIAVEDIVKVQANRDMFQMYSGKLGYALALAVDDVLAGLPDDFSNAVGSLGVNLRYEDVLRAGQYLDDALAPMSGRVIIIAPAEKAGFLNLDQFIHRDYSALRSSQVVLESEAAMMGEWMGMPVAVTSNVEGSNAAGHDNTMFHHDALALVMQMTPKAESQRDIDYLVDKVAVQQLYGALEMRDDHGVFMRGT